MTCVIISELIIETSNKANKKLEKVVFLAVRG